MIDESYADLYGWIQDFWKAFLERPKILRLIAKWAMGKYAYRELYGTREGLLKHGLDVEWINKYVGYCLEAMDYHKDKVKV